MINSKGIILQGIYRGRKNIEFVNHKSQVFQKPQNYF